eukprot:364772-Chlamydomonas_euryale.AAC.4
MQCAYICACACALLPHSGTARGHKGHATLPSSWVSHPPKPAHECSAHQDELDFVDGVAELA